MVETPEYLFIDMTAVNAVIIGRQHMAEPEQFPELVRLVKQDPEAAKEG